MRPAPRRGLARAAGAAASQEVCEWLALRLLAPLPHALPLPPAALLSPLPRTRRQASGDDSTSSISQSSESQACQKLPSHIFIGDTKRLRSFATSSSTPSFISRSPFSPHSSPLSHLLLPPLQPLSLPEHVPASLSQDVQRLRAAATEGLLQPGEPSGAKGVRATGPTSSGGVECRVRQGTVRCSALTQVTVSRHKTLLRQWRRLIGRCAAGHASCTAEP